MWGMMNDLMRDRRLLTAYLYGWKEVAAYFGVTERTMYRWHAITKIPWEKALPRQPSRVRLHVRVADAWRKLVHARVAEQQTPRENNKGALRTVSKN